MHLIEIVSRDGCVESASVLDGPFSGYVAARESFETEAKAWRNDPDVEIDDDKMIVRIDDGPTQRTVLVARGIYDGLQ